MKEYYPTSQLKFVALERIQDEPPPQESADMKMLLYRLAAKEYAGENYPPGHPPEALFHIAQVELITNLLLANQQDDMKERGRIKANSHDLGRTITMDMRHCLLGGIMLRELGVDDDLVYFTVAHHRWGQGVKALSNGFALEVRKSLHEGTTQGLINDLLSNGKADLAGFAVLIADNSKELLTPGSFEPSIVPFDRALGQRLVQKQVDLGRVMSGSHEYQAEKTGMEFLAQVIPVMEDLLSVSYPGVIVHA